MVFKKDEHTQEKKIPKILLENLLQKGGVLYLVYLVIIYRRLPS